MELTHTLEVTLNELLFLDDSMSTLMPWPEEVDFNPANLLRKIGHCLELVLPLPVSTLLTPIDITVGEAWMIREFSKSYAQLGSEKVGLSLKKKSYEAIFALESVAGAIPMASMPKFMREFEEEDLV